MVNTKRRKWILAYLAMLVYAIVVGFTFLATKVIVNTAENFTISLAYRFTFAFLSAFILKKAMHLDFKIKKESLFSLLITSLTYIGFLGFQAFGLMYTTSIVSGILFALIPIFARIAGGIVLKEKYTFMQNFFACISVLAVVAMFVIGNTNSLENISGLGFFLLLLSSLSSALSNVFMRYVKKDYSPLMISYANCLMGFIVFTFFALIYSFKTDDLHQLIAPAADLSFMLAVSYLGIICTLGTGILISYGLRTLPAMTGTIFGNLSTAISIFAGAVFLNEKLYTYQLVCTAFIIVGVLGICIFTLKKDTGE